MKFCNECGTHRDESDFHFKNKERGTLAAYCKDCMTARRRDYYRRNKATEKEKVLVRNRKYYKRNAEYLDKIKMASSCVDCGESDHRVLEFDHVRGQKAFALTQAPSMGVSVTKLKAEVAKCDIRCANCHRRRHYTPRSYTD